MPVKLISPNPEDLIDIKGVKIGVASAEIRKVGRSDVLVLVFQEGTKVGGVFTQNRYCAAPVKICLSHLSQTQGQVRALLVNTGCANAGTGEIGFQNGLESCQFLAELLGCESNQILPCSTGVIMEYLPMERFLPGIALALQRAQSSSSNSHTRSDSWLDAAVAIMTTDTVPKAVSRQVGTLGVSVTGIAKGSGMIRPNMATMLGFIVTDAVVSAETLQLWSKKLADLSFNRITVDGDTSTNDTFLLFATGASNRIVEEGPEAEALWESLLAVSQSLSEALVRDGEGATKFIRIIVEGARNVDEANRVGFSVAQSPLVKTAFFASDPNLGRILAAVGNSGVPDLCVDKVDLYLDEILVVKQGGRDVHYTESEGCRVLAQDEINVRINLGRGDAETVVYTCDLSHDYVSINADYRS